MPGDYNVSGTFNIIDLFPFEFVDFEKLDSRMNLFLEEWDDETKEAHREGRLS